MNFSLNAHSMRYKLSCTETMQSLVVSPYAWRHLELARSEDATWIQRWGHRTIAAIQFIPVIGLLASLIERIVIIFALCIRPANKPSIQFIHDTFNLLPGKVATKISSYLNQEDAEAFSVVSRSTQNSYWHVKTRASYTFSTPDEAAAFFPQTIFEVNEITRIAKANALQILNNILAIPAEERTFDNTVMQLDLAQAEFAICYSRLGETIRLHPDPIMKQVASDTLKSIGSVSENLTSKKVHRAIMEYYNGNYAHETLSEQRMYHLKRLLASFKKAGFMLDDASFAKMKKIRNELAALEGEFKSNIDNNMPFLAVPKDQLNGIREDFISTLEKDGDNYILKCNSLTRVHVMSCCTVESTRRDFFRQCCSRAYPKNWDVWNQMINKGDELAKLLGYESYADYEIDSGMAGRQEVVDKFLKDLTPNALATSRLEWEPLLQDLPESVSLTESGKVKSWDVAFVRSQYGKKNSKIKNMNAYFPMKDTLHGILEVLGNFYGIKLQCVQTKRLWHRDVRMVEAKGADNTLLGYVLLDLFSRKDKVDTHGNCGCIVPPISIDGTKSPAIVIILTNFTKPPALFKHHELRTLFHEFGHAMHAMLGLAEMPTRSGNKTAMDFVEAPSQMMEEWAYNADILKRISKHHTNKEPLSDEQIDLIVKSRDRSYSPWSIMNAMLMLEYFKSGQDKDVQKIIIDLQALYDPYIERDPAESYICDYFQLSAQMNKYKALYYHYLWSKEYALQIYEYIKAHGGPLNPVVGQRYVSKVIGKGGGCDPNDLISDFLSD